MAQKQDDKEQVPWEELAWANMLHQEAVLRLLIEKGIITRAEYVVKMQELKAEMEKKRGK